MTPKSSLVDEIPFFLAHLSFHSRSVSDQQSQWESYNKGIPVAFSIAVMAVGMRNSNGEKCHHRRVMFMSVSKDTGKLRILYTFWNIRNKVVYHYCTTSTSVKKRKIAAALRRPR
jgi:hypothetical protein